MLYVVPMTNPTTEQVRAILKRDNVTEPSGQWSAWDIARELDPEAHKPRSMFDTKAPYPREQYISAAMRALTELRVDTGGGRYVGGTSGHLHSL
jgi:hypothetical protein